MDSKEMLKKIEDGIKECVNKDTFKAYLKAMSLFHNYSFNNSVLIAMQCPHATKVAGYMTWKKLGRHVKKGAKGIRIFVPVSRKKKEEEKDEEDARRKTGTSMDDGKRKAGTDMGTYFMPSTVFDISHTEGVVLPDICTPLSGNIQGNIYGGDNLLKALYVISPVDVSFEEIEGSAKGYYSKQRNKIVIKEDMSEVQTFKTMVHEIAHAIMHSDTEKPRDVKEVEAEATAFIVCSHFGVDTSEYSFEYLASWGGQDAKLVKASFEEIKKTASNIITQLEEELKETKTA